MKILIDSAQLGRLGRLVRREASVVDSFKIARPKKKFMKANTAEKIIGTW